MIYLLSMLPLDIKPVVRFRSYDVRDPVQYGPDRLATVQDRCGDHRLELRAAVDESDGPCVPGGVAPPQGGGWRVCAMCPLHGLPQTLRK